LAIRNIGTQFSTYNGVREKLPLEIIAGVSQGRKCTYSLASYTRKLTAMEYAFSNPARTTSSFNGESTEEKVSFVNNALRHVIVGWSFSKSI
jgi:hypothetical protein